MPPTRDSADPATPESKPSQSDAPTAGSQDRPVQSGSAGNTPPSAQSTPTKRGSSNSKPPSPQNDRHPPTTTLKQQQQMIQAIEHLVKKVTSGEPAVADEDILALQTASSTSSEDELTVIQASARISHSGYLVPYTTVTESDNRSVYLRNVAFHATKADLIHHFKDCGDIVRVTIPLDGPHSLPKGRAYIEFSTLEAVERALKLNETPFLNRSLIVLHKYTTPRDPNVPQPLQLTPQQQQALKSSLPEPTATLSFPLTLPAAAVQQLAEKQYETVTPRTNGNNGQSNLHMGPQYPSHPHMHLHPHPHHIAHPGYAPPHQVPLQVRRPQIRTKDSIVKDKKKATNDENDQPGDEVSPEKDHSGDESVDGQKDGEQVATEESTKPAPTDAKSARRHQRLHDGPQLYPHQIHTPHGYMHYDPHYQQWTYPYYPHGGQYHDQQYPHPHHSRPGVFYPPPKNALLASANVENIRNAPAFVPQPAPHSKEQLPHDDKSVKESKPDDKSEAVANQDKHDESKIDERKLAQVNATGKPAPPPNQLPPYPHYPNHLPHEPMHYPHRPMPHHHYHHPQEYYNHPNTHRVHPHHHQHHHQQQQQQPQQQHYMHQMYYPHQEVYYPPGPNRRTKKANKHKQDKALQAAAQLGDKKRDNNDSIVSAIVENETKSESKPDSVVVPKTSEAEVVEGDKKSPQ